MDTDKTKDAINNLKVKYENSFANYAKDGYISSLALSLMEIPEPQAQTILNSYSDDVKEKVVSKIAELRKYSDDAPIKKRNINFVLAQEDLFTSDDFLELEEQLLDITKEEFVNIYQSNYKESPWILEKLKTLVPNTIFLPELHIAKIYKIVSQLTLNELFYIQTYAPKIIKDTVWSQVSKNKQELLEKESVYFKEATLEDYHQVLRKISSLIDANTVDYLFRQMLTDIDYDL